MIFAALSLSIYKAHKCWAEILIWNCGFQCRPNWCLCHDKVYLCRDIEAYFAIVMLCCEIVATFLTLNLLSLFAKKFINVATYPKLLYLDLLLRVCLNNTD